jgi:MSHA biogenesis protein MshK
MKHLLLLLWFGLASVQADTLKDPTKPSSNKSIINTGQDSEILKTMALKLTAIINNNQNKQAIINGRSFAEGQQVQGYKVVLISQNHVVLKGSDGKQTLYVNNNNIKKDANNGF